MRYVLVCVAEFMVVCASVSMQTVFIFINYTTMFQMCAMLQSSQMCILTRSTSNIATLQKRKLH